MKTYKVSNIPQQLKHFYKLNEMCFYNYSESLSKICYGKYDRFVYSDSFVYLDVCLKNDLILPEYSAWDVYTLMRNFLK